MNPLKRILAAITTALCLAVGILSAAPGMAFAASFARSSSPVAVPARPILQLDGKFAGSHTDGKYTGSDTDGKYTGKAPMDGRTITRSIGGANLSTSLSQVAPVGTRGP